MGSSLFKWCKKKTLKCRELNQKWDICLAKSHSNQTYVELQDTRDEEPWGATSIPILKRVSANVVLSRRAWIRGLNTPAASLVRTWDWCRCYWAPWIKICQLNLQTEHHINPKSENLKMRKTWKWENITSCVFGKPLQEAQPTHKTSPLVSWENFE